MAIISLRAYNREIEGLIDAGELDEAVAHCRHILTTFPKYIATYRLLGKAHLEQQRISDATDIFQRVLSAIPDDFVANVSMSIIREDENNLDAAIWHMELAYESQPSNAAIQDELRRLYGRRDGMQPPKLRLTRGALARMYAKGGLFEQAVSELRAAIAEDPNRTDLHLLLAQTFFELSQRVEAVNLCINVLKKLPYCLSANQVLAVCLPESGEGDAGRNYRQTAISMDPYFAFAVQDAISSDQVPENAVNLERFEWKSGLQVEDVSTQPTWATSLGISMEKPAEQPIPDWLKQAEMPVEHLDSETARADVTPFLWDNKEVENIITEEPKSHEEIPDWLKDAGWKSSSEAELPEESEEVVEQPLAEELETQETEELAKAEIPDWLRGLAPEGVLDNKPSESLPNDKDISIPWLEKQEPGPTDSIIHWLEGKEPDTPSAKPEKALIEPEMAGEEIPTWLKDLDVAYPQLVQEGTGGLPPTTPAFIDEPSQEQSFLDGLIEQSSADKQLTEGIETLPAEQAEEIPELPAAVSEDVPDWIKAIAAELPESYTTQVIGGEAEKAVPEMPPEPETIAQAVFIEETPAPEQEFLGADLPAEELPQAAPGIPAEEPQSTMDEMAPADIQIIEEEPAIELPSIEAEPAIIELPPAETEPVLGEAELDEESLLSEFKAFTEEDQSLHGPADTEPEQAAGLELSDAGKKESDWLDNLVEDMDTSEGEFTPPHGTPVELPLDWVNLDENTLADQTPAAAQPPEDETSAELAMDIPDWIKGLGEVLDSEETIAGDESGVAETGPVEPISIEPELVDAFTAGGDSLPSWLEDMAHAQEEAAPAPASGEAQEGREDELPDWIKDISAYASVSELSPWEEPIPAQTEVQAAEEFAQEAIEPALEWAPEEPADVIFNQEQAEEIAPAAVEPALEWIPADVAEVATSQEQVEESLPEVPDWVMEVLEEEEQVALSADELPLETIMESMQPAAEADYVPDAVMEKEMAAALPEQPEPELTSLEKARSAVAQGLPDQASELYSGLIKKNYHLEELVKDLQEASYRFPVDVSLQVALGDAYFRTGELQEALNAYTRAEELVR